MSRSLATLQEHVLSSGESFCQRYIKSPKYKGNTKAQQDDIRAPKDIQHRTVSGKFYRLRDHEASPFYKIVNQYFKEFERVYPDRYQERYGYWRPVINLSIEKFLKCGDRKEGFARVRCPDCKEEFFISFSCRQRSCCPSCDKKRALLLAHRLNNEVLANIPHQQWVFTLPEGYVSIFDSTEVFWGNYVGRLMMSFVRYSRWRLTAVYPQRSQLCRVSVISSTGIHTCALSFKREYLLNPVILSLFRMLIHNVSRLYGRRGYSLYF